jgi:hypothetical protein
VFRLVFFRHRRSVVTRFWDTSQRRMLSLLNPQTIAVSDLTYGAM